MSLTHDDVERLMKLLDASSFDELQLETDGIKLTLRRGTAATAGEATAPSPPSRQPAAAPPAPATIDPADVMLVRAPMLGTFFCAPQPGAAPFVQAGSLVEADSTIGIVEVMKLMNAVHAGVAGEVLELLVRDGDLVEFDQPLLRLRPR